MKTYPQPPKPKAAVNRAGRAISESNETAAEVALVDQWRAAHGYVINTFQIFFKRRISKAAPTAEFAQRLKRRNTVIDKLRRKRPDGTPLMGDVTSMHDYAGCRLIFNDMESLQRFREYVHSSESLSNVNHKIKHDLDKYNYIEHPKPSGYRGIHDIFQHYPRPHRKDGVNSEPWHGLLVEVQYRTKFQHAWATALEISDLIDGQRTKFDLTDSKRVRFFALASEIIARHYEGMTRAFTELSFVEITSELEQLEDELGILQRLSALKQADQFGKIKKHNVLNIFEDEHGEISLQVIPFSNANLAIERANQLELDRTSINAVYVRADSPNQLRSAYRNYFNDPVDFVKLVYTAIEG